MSNFNDIHRMILELYNSRQYSLVINKIDKILLAGVKNYNYKCNFRYIRAMSLRYLERFDESIAELEDLCKLVKNNPFYTTELFFTYYYLGKYTEAFQMLPELYLIEGKKLSNHSIFIMELVIRKNLGLSTNYKSDTKCDYLKKQITNYDEKLALQHITSHTHDEDSHHIHSIFNESIDIEYLMQCVKINLQNSKKVNANDVLESHYFAVPRIGYDENNICNYLKVVVCPDTHDIITMYPYAYATGDNIPIIECDIDKLFKRKNKENIISRIDKFNRKFNLNGEGL